MSQRPHERRFPRVAIARQAEGWWRDSAGHRHRLKAFLTGLSEGGARLRSADPVPANAPIELSFTLGEKHRVDIRGRVRWWRRFGAEREVGVEFDRPSRPVGEFVEQALASPAR